MMMMIKKFQYTDERGLNSVDVLPPRLDIAKGCAPGWDAAAFLS